ncbi:Hsp20/alpha crystallin family protein [Actinocorallia longicatena]|uniref:SHSP domain-containing protein n=1 Tax=Actinocorallia longicatena TaxID=111803 RepID=A0ABP6QL30_9ACTN
MTPDILRRLGDLRPVASLRQAGRPIRTEDYVEDGRFVVRADLPGLDPARDIDLSVERGHLEIRAVRRVPLHERGHAGISYGLFRRVLRLPEGADGASLETDYTDGVLRLAFKLPGGDKPIPLHGDRRRPSPD